MQIPGSYLTCWQKVFACKDGDCVGVTIVIAELNCPQ